MKKLLSALLASLALVVSACSTSPYSVGGDGITIGAANFPESEIIARIWAGALRDNGYDVNVIPGIGSREVYLGAVEEGSVDIVPDYSGNLAQFFAPNPLPPGSGEEDVDQALKQYLPTDLKVGAQAPAESRDSYRVLPSLGITSLEQLPEIGGFTLAGNPELATRPYGPEGLQELYGATEITMLPIADGGGPLTIAALSAGRAQLADIYTTSPTLDDKGQPLDLVELADPKQLILPQHILPVARKEVPAEALAVLARVNQQLTTEDMVALNTRSIGEEKASAYTIARDWLAEHPH
ncbi:ABC transporter substrate-binding protein [Corynebacterium aquilae]|uniref:ABC-type glycine betaine transport system substrate-binding domain-containing protein n=1 Tax=Corynebacterium aquilae DSM 44791 TaxID=1431546 RepID=A0A1L7CI84_9CORY|nr:ABC transporter substrate-binding protein [Corynebacterium aquilae]APT85570.1 hypothetical protein CAQU_11530 [Corynebacterium aquilae DSM 44791]